MDENRLRKLAGLPQLAEASADEKMAQELILLVEKSGNPLAPTKSMSKLGLDPGTLSFADIQRRIEAIQRAKNEIIPKLPPEQRDKHLKRIDATRRTIFSAIDKMLGTETDEPKRGPIPPEDQTRIKSQAKREQRLRKQAGDERVGVSDILRRQQEQGLQ